MIHRSMPHHQRTTTLPPRCRLMFHRPRQPTHRQGRPNRSQLHQSTALPHLAPKIRILRLPLGWPYQFHIKPVEERVLSPGCELSRSLNKPSEFVSLAYAIAPRFDHGDMNYNTHELGRACAIIVRVTVIRSTSTQDGLDRSNLCKVHIS
jgi:hypothetical protein